MAHLINMLHLKCVARYVKICLGATPTKSDASYVISQSCLFFCVKATCKTTFIWLVNTVIVVRVLPAFFQAYRRVLYVWNAGVQAYVNPSTQR